MSATIIIKPVDWFARQRRDQDPGQRHEPRVIELDFRPTDLDERPCADLVRRRLGWAQCPVYTMGDADEMSIEFGEVKS